MKDGEIVKKVWASCEAMLKERTIFPCGNTNEGWSTF